MSDASFYDDDNYFMDWEFLLTLESDDKDVFN